MADEYMNVQEAAAYLGVSRSKVWALIKQDRLKAYENDLDKRERLVLKADVEQLKKPRPEE